MIAPEYQWVNAQSCPRLVGEQAASLEHTVEAAERHVDKAIVAVIDELNVSGSQTNPELLAERIREVWRRKSEVLDVIRGLEVALDAAGKL